MIQTEIHADRDLIVAHPSGALSEADFAAFAAEIDGYINAHDRAPALVFHIDALPHWDGLSALLRHAKLVRAHHRIIPKVAIIGDIGLMSALPTVADLFVKAKMRHFPKSRAADAMDWAAAPGDDPGAFEVLPAIAGNVLALRCRGVITAEDYAQTLRPLIEDKLKTHDRINLLVVVAAAFQSLTGGALWEDARLGVAHAFSFDKVALVTDNPALRMGAKMFSPLTPAQLNVFALADLEAAKDWVKR